MNQWDARKYPLGRFNAAQIKIYCVEDPWWQRFRVSLKGLPTETKLDKLQHWWVLHLAIPADYIRVQCQVTNYLYALRRGGQLDYNLAVRR